MNKSLKITFADSNQDEVDLDKIFNHPFSMQNLDDGLYQNIASTFQNLGETEEAAYSLFGHGKFLF